MKDCKPTKEDMERATYVDDMDPMDPVRLVAHALGVKNPFPYLEHRESEDPELARKHEAFRKKQYHIDFE